MRKRVLVGVFIFIIAFLFLTPHSSLSSKNLSFSKMFSASPQEVKKPKYDYMSTFLSRNTQPLGLKKDPELEILLKQSTIKWAIRAGKKHILD